MGIGVDSYDSEGVYIMGTTSPKKRRMSPSRPIDENELDYVEKMNYVDLSSHAQFLFVGERKVSPCTRMFT